MDVISYALSKKYTDEEIDKIIQELEKHKKTTTPHEAKDLQYNKTYKFGLQRSIEGNPQIIFKEVIE